MKRNANKYIRVHFSEENYQKIIYIAKDEYRSISQQVGMFRDEGIRQYEIKHGKINIEKVK